VDLVELTHYCPAAEKKRERERGPSLTGEAEERRIPLVLSDSVPNICQKQHADGSCDDLAGAWCFVNGKKT
jgi:hypothetical protein